MIIEKKLSIQEAVDELLMSQSTIYSWIERGKLKYEEFPSGRFILMSEQQIKEIRESNMNAKRNRNLRPGNQEKIEYQEIPVCFPENDDFPDDENLEFLRKNPENVGNFSPELAMFISDLASKAGKYELLADLQKEKENDKVFWQNKFFESENLCKTLQLKIQKLELEILNLKETSKNPETFAPRKFLGIFPVNSR